jgi:hypothetical protein
MEASSSCVKQLKWFEIELKSVNRTEGYIMVNIRTCFSPTSYAHLFYCQYSKEHQFVQAGVLPVTLRFENFILCCTSRLSGFNIWLHYITLHYIAKSDTYLHYVGLSLSLSVPIFIRLIRGVRTAWIFMKCGTVEAAYYNHFGTRAFW